MRRIRKSLALLLALLMLLASVGAAGADTVKYTVTGSANRGGTVTAGVEVEKGAEAALDIKANAGYKLVCLMVNGVSTDPVSIKNYQLVLSDVQKNMAVRALFVKS